MNFTKQKQIVISSDKHPREIATLEERLRSRFEWGITADIQPPDYETKMAILKKRAELEHLDINQEVMQYVATNINSNIRELEGALNKIYVFANLEKKPVTLELAENALKDTIECQKEVTPQLIMDVVAEHYNISVSDIISKKKNKEIANPRQICMYLSVNIPTILSKISEKLWVTVTILLLYTVMIKLEKCLKQTKTLKAILISSSRN